jgi:ABC-type sugar transport system substrate-binding protein
MSDFRVALFLQDRLNDYQSLLQADCEQTARRHDLQVNILSAEASAETQIRQVRTVLAEREATRPRALIISPVSEMAMLPLVHDAARLGIAWVFLSRWNDAIHELRRQYPKIPIFAVLPDHMEIGRLQGQQLRLLLNPNDELVYIQGPMSTYSTRRRRAGLEQELADKQDFRWSHFNADWSQNGGESAMRSWLTTFTARSVPKFVIAAQSDAMAMGARQAVVDWGSSGGQIPRGDLRAVGCDGSPSFGQRLVTLRQLSATVIIPPIAGRAVEEIVGAFRYGKYPAAETTVPVVSYPDIDTLKSEVKRHK